MSAQTKIEWVKNEDGTQGRTWNPLTGCTKVSPGCDHCYAKTMHERFNGPGSFDSITLHPDRLDQPLRWRKPTTVFVNSMSDLFHADVPDEFIARVFAVMALAPQHTFQLLTKRHARMRSLLSSDAFTARVADAAYRIAWGEDADVRFSAGRAEYAYRTWPPLAGTSGVRVLPWPLPNVWLGVSVESQQWADIRIPALLETPAAVRWISAEPLLGPLDLDGKVEWHGGRDRLTYWLGRGRPYFPPGEPGSMLSGPMSDKPSLDWVVVGGESGPGARPMHPDWVRTIRDQCEEAATPFLFKQWGAWTSGAVDRVPTSDPYAPGSIRHQGWVDLDGALHHFGEYYADEGWQHVWRVGKGKAGRVLDGRTHDGYPAERAGVTS